MDDDDEPPMLVSLPVKPADTINEDTTNTSSLTPTVEPLQELPPCPVMILSGFLGSGKTTLIQYILKSPDHGKRIAVIENEFGEGLDVESLIARDGVAEDGNNTLQDLIELPNGCICCTVKDSLVTTLETLLTKRSDLDYILIEASGMANPGPIASVFWLDDALESRLQLYGVVTLVDGYHITSQLEETEEAAQQVAYADRLVINKVDLLNDGQNAKVGAPTLEQVTSTLRQLHPTAPIQTTTYSQIPDLDWILDANCFGGVQRIEDLDAIWNRAAEAEIDIVGTHDDHHVHSHDHDHDCQQCPTAPSQHKHTDAVSTVPLQKSGSLHLHKLHQWLAKLLWPDQDESNDVLTKVLYDEQEKETYQQRQEKRQKSSMQIFRLKGIVSTYYDVDYDDTASSGNGIPTSRYCIAPTNNNNTPAEQAQPPLDRRRFIVQAVHDLWEIHPASDDLQWQDTVEFEDVERMNKLVVIGKHLQADELQKGFATCFIDDVVETNESS